MLVDQRKVEEEKFSRKERNQLRLGWRQVIL